MTDERFDELSKEMRGESVAPEQVAAARDRVWRQISGATSWACVEFRPEFEDYRAGRLTESRRLLIEDHLGRCAECRRVLERRGAGPRPAPAGPGPALHWSGWPRWAVAASVIVAALYLGREQIDSAFAPSGPK